MNRASSATGWVRNPIMKSPDLDPRQASSYELGWTFNPMSGCNNQIDGMCQGGNFPCYAYRLANGRLRNRYLANKNTATRNYDEDSYPFYPRFWEDRLRQLEFRNKCLIEQGLNQPRGIFVCDMSDLFGIGVPEEWTEAILNECDNKHDRFYLLTKQPQNLFQFSPFPDNCYVGVTATDQVMWNEALRYLTDIKATVKYMSIEPYLERIVPEYTLMLKSGIKQVIIGSQTRPTVMPKIEWVKEIVEACDKAKLPIFMKENLKPLFSGGVYDSKGNFTLLPMGKLRQEIPDVRT